MTDHIKSNDHFSIVPQRLREIREYLKTLPRENVPHSFWESVKRKGKIPVITKDTKTPAVEEIRMASYPAPSYLLSNTIYERVRVSFLRSNLLSSPSINLNGRPCFSHTFLQFQYQLRVLFNLYTAISVPIYFSLIPSYPSFFPSSFLLLYLFYITLWDSSHN